MQDRDVKVSAQPAPKPIDRSTEFVAVEGGVQTTSAGTLLVAAYGVMWALLLLFVFLGWRRQRSLESRLGDLEKALAAATSSSSKG